MPDTSTTTIRVDFNGHDAWEITFPDPEEKLTCATLDDARRTALLHAARRQPCELVVRDAYHRLLLHQTPGAAAATESDRR